MKIKKIEKIEAWQLTRKVYQLIKKPEFSVRLQVWSPFRNSLSEIMQRHPRTCLSSRRRDSGGLRNLLLISNCSLSMPIRARILGFINYLKKYNKQNVSNRDPLSIQRSPSGLRKGIPLGER